jgi:hypothetical protein
MSSARRKRPQGPRGYVLVVALFLILALTVTVAIVYEQTASQLQVSSGIRRQAIAAARANMGARRVIAETNSTTAVQFAPLFTPASNPCVSNTGCNLDTIRAEDGTDTPNYRININSPRGLVDNGNVLGLEENGGLQYRAYAFKQQINGATKYWVVSIGYHGYNPDTRPNSTVYESTVVVEVAPPAAPASSTSASGIEGTG